jgi:hypothetical protein
MSDLSLECAPERTSADHLNLWVHGLIHIFHRASRACCAMSVNWSEADFGLQPANV